MGSEGGCSHLPCWRKQHAMDETVLTPSWGHSPPASTRRLFQRKNTQTLSCSWKALHPCRNVWRADLRVFKSLKWSWRNWPAFSYPRGLPLPQRRGNALRQENLGEGSRLAQLRLFIQLWSNLPPRNHVPSPTPCGLEWASNSAQGERVRGQRAVLNQILGAAQTQSKSSHSPLWVTWESVLNCARAQEKMAEREALWTGQPKHQTPSVKYSSLSTHCFSVSLIRRFLSPAENETRMIPHVWCGRWL